MEAAKALRSGKHRMAGVGEGELCMMGIERQPRQGLG